MADPTESSMRRGSDGWDDEMSVDMDDVAMTPNPLFSSAADSTPPVAPAAGATATSASLSSIKKEHATNHTTTHTSSPQRRRSRAQSQNENTARKTSPPASPIHTANNVTDAPATDSDSVIATMEDDFSFLDQCRTRTRSSSIAATNNVQPARRAANMSHDNSSLTSIDETAEPSSAGTTIVSNTSESRSHSTSPVPPPPPPVDDDDDDDDDAWLPPPPSQPPPIRLARPSMAMSEGNVAARLRSLQMLEEAARNPVPVSISPRDAHQRQQSTRVKQWKQRFEDNEDLPMHASSTSALLPAAPAVATAASPNPPSMSSKDRNVFANVGASTLPALMSTGLLPSPSLPANHPQLACTVPPPASSGSTGLACNGRFIAACWGARGNQLMVVPMERQEKHWNDAAMAWAAMQHGDGETSTEEPNSKPDIPSSTDEQSFTSFLIDAHEKPILDFVFNPFQPDEIVTASLDGVLKFWRLNQKNDGASTSTRSNPPLTRLTEPYRILQLDIPSHIESVRVHSMSFNPVASGVLAVALSPLHVVSIIDLAASSASSPASSDAAVSSSRSSPIPAVVRTHCDVGSNIFHHVWSPNGRSLATTSADRRLRIFDLHGGQPAQLAASTSTKDAISDSAKPSRIVWLDGSHVEGSNKLATLSFNRHSCRVVSLWDRRSLEKGPIDVCQVDTTHTLATHPLLFYHAPQRLMMVSGKGDASIKFLEINSNLDSCSLLNEYHCIPTSRTHRAMCMGSPLPTGMMMTSPSGALHSPSTIYRSSAHDLPNLYRMAPASFSSNGTLVASSASASTSPSSPSAASVSFIEMIRLRRSDILHRAFVRRRMTMEADGNECYPGWNGLTSPMMTSEAFFNNNASVPISLSSASSTPSSSGASTRDTNKRRAFDVLLKEVLPLLQDPDELAAFKSTAIEQLQRQHAATSDTESNNSTDVHEDGAHTDQEVAPHSATANTPDLAQLRSVLAALSSIPSLSPSPSSTDELSKAHASIQDLTQRIQEYEEMIGAASLAHKQAIQTIAKLEKNLALAQQSTKQSKQNNAAAATAAAATAASSQSQSPPSVASPSPAPTLPEHFLSNLSMLHRHGYDDSGWGEPEPEPEPSLDVQANGHVTAAEGTSPDQEQVWAWKDFQPDEDGNSNNSSNHLVKANATTASNFAAIRTVPMSTIDKLLRPTPSVSLDQPQPLASNAMPLFQCPRLGVGLELGFSQLHSLLYLQSTSTMHMHMP